MFFYAKETLSLVCGFRGTVCGSSSVRSLKWAWPAVSLTRASGVAETPTTVAFFGRGLCRRALRFVGALLTTVKVPAAAKAPITAQIPGTKAWTCFLYAGGKTINID